MYINKETWMYPPPYGTPPFGNTSFPDVDGPPTMGLRPPMVNSPHESWGKLTIGGRRPIVGGPRGAEPP